MANKSIFDDLKEIKDKISEEQFIKLTNHIEELNNKIEEAKNKLIRKDVCKCVGKYYFTYDRDNNIEINFCIHDKELFLYGCYQLMDLMTNLRIMEHFRYFAIELDSILANPEMTMDDNKQLFKEDNLFSTQTSINFCEEDFNYFFILFTNLMNADIFDEYTRSYLCLVIFELAVNSDLNHNSINFASTHNMYFNIKDKPEFNRTCKFFKVDHTMYPHLFRNKL